MSAQTVEIEVVDGVDPSMQRAVLNLRGLRRKPIEMEACENGVARMVDRIVERAGRPGSIKVLRIYAHGNDGILNVAGGDQLAPKGSEISLGSLPLVGNDLKRLKSYFAADARVELLGCLVAKGRDGEQLMLELSHLWGVLVQAAPVSLPIGALKFSGVVYQAAPGGGMSCTLPGEIARNP